MKGMNYKKFREAEDPIGKEGPDPKVIVHSMYANEINKLIDLQAKKLNELDELVSHIRDLACDVGSMRGLEIIKAIDKHG